MPKPSEIFDTPEAISRVGGNEEQRQEFGLLFGASLSYDQQLLEAIWDWHLTTKDQEKEEAIRRERERITKSLRTVYYGNDDEEDGFIQLSSRIAMFIKKLEALPTEDNK